MPTKWFVSADGNAVDCSMKPCIDDEAL